jgi:hypothetical protein
MYMHALNMYEQKYNGLRKIKFNHNWLILYLMMLLQLHRFYEVKWDGSMMEWWVHKDMKRDGCNLFKGTAGGTDEIHKKLQSG